MKVGDIVYIFDHNHRVYPEDRSLGSGPIYREHFVKRQIVGETTRSWLVSFEGSKPDSRCVTKHAKKELRNGLYTLEQIDEEVYMHENRYHIAQAVHHVDYATLKKIAELINYKERK